MRNVYIHLVSDATGATLQGMAAAALAQFKDIKMVQRLWPLIKNQKHLDRFIADLEIHPGPVFFTLFNDDLTARLRAACLKKNVPAIAVMEPIIIGLSEYLGQKPMNVAGLQHMLDDTYFSAHRRAGFCHGVR